MGTSGVECLRADGLASASLSEEVYQSVRQVRPSSRAALRNYLKVFMNLSVPDKVLCPGHCSPMDYLWYSYSRDFPELRGGQTTANGDCIVWANRGGGKTMLAGVATLLEGLFKPQCQTRILAGSLDQSSRMFEYLADYAQDYFEDCLDGRILKESCQFVNGTKVGILSQSARAVRGRHIHKLRCDEIELFDEDVFNAAKYVTRSTDGICGAMEMFSTLHRPYGMMQRLIDDSQESGIPVFRWCLWEVIEKCGPDRSCSRCPLWSDCGGRAKEADGYLAIDDCISQMRRSSRAGFEAEMLCKRPSLENVVFADFDPDIHVRPIEYDPNLPLYRAIDFGFVNPFVCLWIQVDNEGVVRVIDEYERSRAAIHAHAEQLRLQTPCDESRVTATFCDPAGAGRNDVTGTSAVKELREMGIRTRFRRSGIVEGVEKIRALLKAGDGTSKFLVSPRCVRLIEAMCCYHYSDKVHSVKSELPDKDGIYDHPIDALRYFIVGVAKSSKPKMFLY